MGDNKQYPELPEPAAKYSSYSRNGDLYTVEHMRAYVDADRERSQGRGSKGADMTPPKIIHDEFTLGNLSANFNLVWSDSMCSDDKADILSWLELIERRVRRLPEIGPAVARQRPTKREMPMSAIVLTTPEELRQIISEEVRQAIATAQRPAPHRRATEMPAALRSPPPTPPIKEPQP